MVRSEAKRNGEALSHGLCSLIRSLFIRYLFTFWAEMGLHRGVQALGYRIQASLLAVRRLLQVLLAQA